MGPLTGCYGMGTQIENYEMGPKTETLKTITLEQNGTKHIQYRTQDRKLSNETPNRKL